MALESHTGLEGEWGGAALEDRDHPRAVGGVGPEESSCVDCILEKMRTSFGICMDGHRTALKQEEWRQERLMGKERVQLLEEGHQKIQVPHEGEQILSFPSCSLSYQRI